MVVGMLVMVLGAIGMFYSYFNPSKWLVIVSVSAVGIGFGGAINIFDLIPETSNFLILKE